jgi:hypothetical protein
MLTFFSIVCPPKVSNNSRLDSVIFGFFLLSIPKLSLLKIMRIGCIEGSVIKIVKTKMILFFMPSVICMKISIRECSNVQNCCHFVTKKRLANSATVSTCLNANLQNQINTQTRFTRTRDL